MQNWAPMLLGNTLLAGVLAIGAIIAMRLRRPAVAHALWLLVLFKLVTPPIWDLPIPKPAWQAQTPPPAIVARVETDTNPQTIHFTPPQEVVETVVTIPEGGTLISLPAHPVQKQFEWPSIDSILIAVWVAGTMLWLAVLAIRMRRFNRFARSTKEAPSELQQRANLLAGALNLPASPPVELVPASISPMLWHDMRSTRLLVPEHLLHALDPEQRDALLLHELAHLKRKDHLTRLLEIFVTAIFWWHPLVWIARRGLREAEEQCCDAWVIWAMPESARRYADALVDTLDFLAASPLSLPPGASGLGGLQSLQRRLTMIFTHTPPRAMSWNGRIAILVLLGLLPLGPVWSQQPQLVAPAEPTAPAAVREMVPATAPAVQSDQAAIPAFRAEQLLVLNAIDTRTSSALVEHVFTGDIQVVRSGSRLASGEITAVGENGARYRRADGTQLLISPGTTFDGLKIESTRTYRQQLIGIDQPLLRGGRAGNGVAAPMTTDSALSLEERMRIRRDEARRVAAPAGAQDPTNTTLTKRGAGELGLTDPQSPVVDTTQANTAPATDAANTAPLENRRPGDPLRWTPLEGTGSVVLQPDQAVAPQAPNGNLILENGPRRAAPAAPAGAAVTAPRGVVIRTGKPNPGEAPFDPADVALPARPAAVPPDRAVVMALLEAMADTDQYVKANAQQALAGLGIDALPIYVEAASSTTVAVRVGALQAMLDLLNRYVPYRIQQGRGGRSGSQLSSFQGGRGGGGGGRGGRNMGRGPLQTANQQGLDLQAQIAPVAVKALRDANADARMSGANLLIFLIDQPETAIPALAGLLDSDDVNLRTGGLMGLSNVVRYRGPERLTPHLPAIIKRLGDATPNVRISAINLLGECGPTAQSAVPELLKVLKDSDASVRAAAATALGQIQAPPPVQALEAFDPNDVGL